MNPMIKDRVDPNEDVPDLFKKPILTCSHKDCEQKAYSLEFKGFRLLCWDHFKKEFPDEIRH